MCKQRCHAILKLNHQVSIMTAAYLTWDPNLLNV